jgi:hypothetical protein
VFPAAADDLQFAVQKAKEYLSLVAIDSGPRLSELTCELFAVKMSTGLPKSPPFRSSSSSEESPKRNVGRSKSRQPSNRILKRGDSKTATAAKRDPRTKEVRASDFITSYLPKNYKSQSDVFERYNNVLVSEAFPNGIMEKEEFLNYWKTNHPNLVAKHRNPKRQRDLASPLRPNKLQKALSSEDIFENNDNDMVKVSTLSNVFALNVLSM